ncbi:MobA/MobL family protein, partial [Komagataeibacter sucrofermentans]
HTTVKEWRGFRQHKPGQPWRYQPQNAQPDRLLERAGQTARVDHRSYERQGVEVVPGVHLGPHSTAVERKAAHQAEQEGREYEPRTYRARANADAAEKNGIAKALRHIIESAEQAIAKVQQAAEDLMDWFADLADEVGRDAIERKEQERQERQRAIMERLAREQREAQKRAEQESARQKLIDEGFTGGRKGPGGRRR